MLPFTPEVGDLAMDPLTAATAVWRDPTVLYDDGDFERVAGVDPRRHQQWAVPRGSVD